MPDTAQFLILICDQSRLGVTEPVIALERNGQALHEISLLEVCLQEDPCYDAITGLREEAEHEAGCPLAWIEGTMDGNGYIMRATEVGVFEAIVLSEAIGPAAVTPS